MITLPACLSKPQIMNEQQPRERLIYAKTVSGPWTRRLVNEVDYWTLLVHGVRFVVLEEWMVK